MKMIERKVQLFCADCNKNTLHKIVYINDEVARIECAHCHKSIDTNLDIKNAFYNEAYQRIYSKPKRLIEELGNNPGIFLVTLPFRLISKPYRITKGLKRSRKIIKKFKENHKKSM